MSDLIDQELKFEEKIYEYRTYKTASILAELHQLRLLGLLICPIYEIKYNSFFFKY